MQEIGLTEKSLIQTSPAENENWEHTIIEQIREHYNTVHATQKPVRLMQRIIGLVASKGENVCDPFCGGGSTGVATVETEHTFYGFEINNDPIKIKDKYIDGYFTSACKRYEAALIEKAQKDRAIAYKNSQQNLF
jgi:site-specific DNA-methyltransferase (adenine-specific)